MMHEAPIAKFDPRLDAFIDARPVHDIGVMTFFCRKCGASEGDIILRGFFCFTADNLVGVSHVIAQRKLSKTEPLAAPFP